MPYADDEPSAVAKADSESEESIDEGAEGNVDAAVEDEVLRAAAHNL